MGQPGSDGTNKEDCNEYCQEINFKHCRFYLKMALQRLKGKYRRKTERRSSAAYRPAQPPERAGPCVSRAPLPPTDTSQGVELQHTGTLRRGLAHLLPRPVCSVIRRAVVIYLSVYLFCFNTALQNWQPGTAPGTFPHPPPASSPRSCPKFSSE